jgi:hypothetical protein
MGPRVSVCRKGEHIYLTIEGEFNYESSRELLAVVRQLLMTSLKCATPNSPVTYCLKTRGKVDLEKIAHFQKVIDDRPCCSEVCEDPKVGQEQGVVPLKEESLKRRPRNGLTLVKGGAF